MNDYINSQLKTTHNILIITIIVLIFTKSSIYLSLKFIHTNKFFLIIIYIIIYMYISIEVQNQNLVDFHHQWGPNCAPTAPLIQMCFRLVSWSSVPRTNLYVPKISFPMFPSHINSMVMAVLTC